MKKPKIFSSIKNKISTVFKKKRKQDDFDFEDTHDDPNFTQTHVTDNEDDKTLSNFSPDEQIDELEDKTIPNLQMQSDSENSLVSEKNQITIKKDKIVNFIKDKFKKNEGGIKNVKSSSTSMINVDTYFNAFFNATNRKQVHRIFITTSFVILAFAGGKILGLFLTPPVTTKKTSVPSPSIVSNKGWKQEIASIRSRDLFGAKGKITKKPIKAPGNKPKRFEGICKISSISSSLPFTLLSTIVLQDQVKSIAAVQMRSKKELLNIRQGENVQSMAQIGKIEDKKVIFKNLQTGQCEYIQVKEKPQKRFKNEIKVEKDLNKGKKVIAESKKEGIKNEGNNYKIKKNIRDKMLSNISEVLTQARAVQITNPDGSLCFRMQEVTPGSIYTSLGIQNADTICGINGKKINNLNEMMSLFSQLKNLDHFELSVKREGSDQNFEYDFID